MKKVEVSLENRSYDILIDENLISKFPVYLEGLLNRKFLAIVTLIKPINNTEQCGNRNKGFID